MPSALGNEALYQLVARGDPSALLLQNYIDSEVLKQRGTGITGSIWAWTAMRQTCPDCHAALGAVGRRVSTVSVLCLMP